MPQQKNTTALDKYMFPSDAPISQGTLPPIEIPYEWGLRQKIQTRQAKLSKINLGTFVQLSNTALTLGTLANNASADLTTSLTPQSPHAQVPNFAIAYVGVFIGTSSSSYDTTTQVYPTLGGSETAGNWDVRGDYDYNGVGGTLAGTISAWTGIIVNKSGATGTVQFITRWKYININSGTVT